MRGLIGIGAILVLTGCAAPQPQIFQISSAFNPDDARTQNAEGQATVRGAAFLRQQGGGVVTCAGQDVHLIPISPYGSERLEKIYGAAPDVGQVVYKDIKAVGPVTFVPDPPAYKEFSRNTKCDAQGNFEFERVKDGDYYVSTGVAWIIGARQGGALTMRVKVDGSKSSKLIITR